MLSRQHNIESFYVVVLQRTAKKCTKNYNARAQLLCCLLNLLFSDVSVAVAVVVFLNSLIICWNVTGDMQIKRCCPRELTRFFILETSNQFSPMRLINIYCSTKYRNERIIFRSEESRNWVQEDLGLGNHSDLHQILPQRKITYIYAPSFL